MIVNLYEPLNPKKRVLHFGGDFYHDLNPLNAEDYNQLILEDIDGKNVSINLKNIMDFSLIAPDPNKTSELENNTINRYDR